MIKNNYFNKITMLLIGISLLFGGYSKCFGEMSSLDAALMMTEYKLSPSPLYGLNIWNENNSLNKEKENEALRRLKMIPEDNIPAFENALVKATNVQLSNFKPPKFYISQIHSLFSGTGFKSSELTAIIQNLNELSPNAVNMWIDNNNNSLPIHDAAILMALSQSKNINHSKTETKKTKDINILPPFTSPLKGSNEVRVKNPNDFEVTVALRSGKKGKDFEVTSNGTSSVFAPDGDYEIYFVYSDKPDELYKGDNFSLKNNGIEIQIVKVVEGNYGIKRIK